MKAKRKRNSSPATTESPYFSNPSDCCPAGHHQGNMMNPSHDAMMGGGMMHHPMMQHPQQQQQQHFSPGGGNTHRSCAGCGSKIVDRFLLHALDRYWHNACLKCSCCQATLADIGSSCFTKGGMILCKHDYIKMFGATGACNGCGQMIPANDYVMRAQGNVYHLKCFACVKCHNQLVAGDRFNLVNGSVLCEQDCIKMLKGTATTVGTVRKNSKMRMNAAIKV